MQELWVIRVGVFVFIFTCVLWMCVEIHINLKSVHISVCVCVLFILCGKTWWAVCVVKYAWRFVCIQGCKWIAFPKKVNSCQLNASRPGTFKSYGSNLHELNTLDRTMTNCKLCLTFVYLLWFLLSTQAQCVYTVAHIHSLARASTALLFFFWWLLGSHGAD